MMSGTAELVRDLREKGIGLNLHGENLEVSIFKEDVEPEVFELIRANKVDLIEYIRSLNLDFKLEVIPVTEIRESYPVSDAQRRLWILSPPVARSQQAFRLLWLAHLRLKSTKTSA